MTERAQTTEPATGGLAGVVEREVQSGAAPGAVALVARGDDVEVAAGGGLDVEGRAPMTRDTIFRIASVCKLVTATATMVLVDEGRIALADPAVRWLAARQVELGGPTPPNGMRDLCRHAAG